MDTRFVRPPNVVMAFVSGREMPQREKTARRISSNTAESAVFTDCLTASLLTTDSVPTWTFSPAPLWLVNPVGDGIIDGVPMSLNG